VRWRPRKEYAHAYVIGWATGDSHRGGHALRHINLEDFLEAARELHGWYGHSEVRSGSGGVTNDVVET